MRKYIRMGAYIICILSVAFALMHAQKVETVDGVRVVHNGSSSKWGKNPAVSLQLVRTIGEVETDDVNLAFHMPSDIAVDRPGNIYILDSGNHRIQKFDAAGRCITTIGAKGQGPGEFYFPVSIDIDAQGFIYVSDPQNQRIQILKPDGTEHETVTSSKTGLGVARISGSGEIIMGQGGLINIGPGSFDKDQKQPNLIKTLDTQGNVLRDFGQPRDFKNVLVNRMGNGTHFALDRNNNIYIGFDYQNRIEKYSGDGQLLWTADRKLNYSTAPPKDKGSEKGSGGMVRIQMPQMNRCSNGIAVDDKGRIWVVTLKRQTREDESVQVNMNVEMSGGQRTMSVKPTGNVEKRETDVYELEVYADDGTLLGKIPLNHFVDNIRIYGDRLFLLDQMRGAQYYEYKIIEK